MQARIAHKQSANATFMRFKQISKAKFRLYFSRSEYMGCDLWALFRGVCFRFYHFSQSVQIENKTLALLFVRWWRRSRHMSQVCLFRTTSDWCIFISNSISFSFHSNVAAMCPNNEFSVHISHFKALVSIIWFSDVRAYIRYNTHFLVKTAKYFISFSNLLSLPPNRVRVCLSFIKIIRLPNSERTSTEMTPLNREKNLLARSSTEQESMLTFWLGGIWQFVRKWQVEIARPETEFLFST